MFGIRLDGWMVGVGRPVTCRINGCGGGAAGGSWCGRGAQVRTREDHTGPHRTSQGGPHGPAPSHGARSNSRTVPTAPAYNLSPSKNQPKKGLNFELLFSSN